MGTQIKKPRMQKKLLIEPTRKKTSSVAPDTNGDKNNTDIKKSHTPDVVRPMAPGVYTADSIGVAGFHDIKKIIRQGINETSEFYNISLKMSDRVPIGMPSDREMESANLILCTERQILELLDKVTVFHAMYERTKNMPVKYSDASMMLNLVPRRIRQLIKKSVIDTTPIKGGRKKLPSAYGLSMYIIENMKGKMTWKKKNCMTENSASTRPLGKHV